MKMFKFAALVTTSFFGLALMGGTANAVPCSDETTGIFKDAGFSDPAYDACVDGGAGNDQGNGGIVDGGFDGHNDWVEVAMLSDEAGPDGTFDILAAWWNTYDELIVTLKDGGTCPNGDKWSAYYLIQNLSGTVYWRYGQGGNGNTGCDGDLNYKEIGSVLGITEGNVKVRVFRAREKLLQILNGGASEH